MLGDPPTRQSIGQIALHEHQLSGVRRLVEALERFNGALLCDEVGMGKTYVALAVARQFSDTLVVMPAALVAMWRSALTQSDSRADIITFETLSRIDLDGFRGRSRPEHRRDLVIVDEAHHARNPRTNRYFALEHLVRGSKVLLLSATPIHNRRHDLVALLSLFLGSRAEKMTVTELSQCVIRREQRQVEQSGATPSGSSSSRSLRIPTVRPATRHAVGDEPAIVEALMDLPPPVPFRDGGVAATLVARGLVHQWASSEAALREALRRRIARATALCASLESGTYPTRNELEHWVYDDGALQLGFAELLSSPITGHAELLTALQAHLHALRSIKQRFNSVTLDAQRADIIMRIRASRTNAKTVAFSQYTETIAMLYRRLVKYGYVAMLTSHGARVAGGPLTRTEAITRFAPAATGSRPPPRAETIQLLLTTDLLSEGVNLQDADTMIHLDLPWTAARMEQRVGRLARLGSAHAEVHVHVIPPPPSAAAVLATEPTVERKQTIARAEESTPRNVEQLRTLLESWRQNPEAIMRDDPLIIVGAAISETSGFIAAVSLDGVMQLVVGGAGGVTADLDGQLRICAQRMTGNSEVRAHAVSNAIASVQRWCGNRRAAAAAGVSDSQALKRRTLIARIDRSIESARPHQRTARLELAQRARDVVTTTQCADVERELDTLVHAHIEEEEWLAAIANLETQQAIHIKSADESVRIHAILLLTVKRPRSRPRRGPESP